MGEREGGGEAVISKLTAIAGSRTGKDKVQTYEIVTDGELQRTCVALLRCAACDVAYFKWDT